MNEIAVLGAGAFGTALGIALAAEGAPVTLWARDRADAEKMAAGRMTGKRLPGLALPENLSVTADLEQAQAEIQLLTIPMQALGSFLSDPRAATGPCLVACMKGVDLESGTGPTALISCNRPGATAAVLTGPSFAADIARGLPTALTLACTDAEVAKRLQMKLSTPTLRLYRTDDVIGAEFGGALKNVIALAAGIAIGAGLGDSARAALIARGLAEITRIAVHFGAQVSTLMGLSGLGDLVLTATSEKSRNYAAGLALGRDAPLPHVTIEGIATAHAMARVADREGIDAPLVRTVSAVASGKLAVDKAIETLLARPLKEE